VARVSVTARGKARTFEIRFIDVYMKASDGWKAIVWQLTHLPE
jgi:hypothetical protein